MVRIRGCGDVLVLREGEQRLHTARLLYNVVVVLTDSVVVLTNSVVVLTNSVAVLTDSVVVLNNSVVVLTASVVVLTTLREGEQRLDTARLLQRVRI